MKDPTLEELVKKLFPEELIVLSSSKKVYFYTAFKSKGVSRTFSKEALYPLDIIETDKKIYFDRKDRTDPFQYFVIDKKDIEKTETEMKDGEGLKKITMLPKRMYEFQIYHFTAVNNLPKDVLGRFGYRVRKFFDSVFGFMAIKYTTEITY